MLHVYICEKCGKQFEDENAAYECEYGHLREFHYEMDTELKKRWIYNPGEHAPRQITMMEREDKWNETEQKYDYTYTCYTYKYVNTLPESKTAEITEEYRLRREREDREFREWSERWNRQEAERKAAAEQEAANNA